MAREPDVCTAAKENSPFLTFVEISYSGFYKCNGLQCSAFPVHKDVKVYKYGMYSLVNIFVLFAIVESCL